MKGAIFFASKYGSTAQYAQWIAEATGLSAFDLNSSNADPSDFDFLVIGSPIIYYKLWFHKWAGRHLSTLQGRPTVLFSVSGAGAGAKLDGWIADSLPPELISHVEHVALRGRQKPDELTLFDRAMLIIGGLKNPDPVAGKEELQGFDFMDRSSIAPIVELVRRLQGEGADAAPPVGEASPSE